MSAVSTPSKVSTSAAARGKFKPRGDVARGVAQGNGPRESASRNNSARSEGTPGGAKSSAGPKPESEILFQKFFKSVGPRTYAAQVKRAGNGNHFLVLTEGKRDDSGEVRKTRLFLFSEDFAEYFRMLHETAQFIRANPVPEEIKTRQARKWSKQGEKASAGK